MGATLEEVAEQALSLPAASRAELADLLVQSLEGQTLREIEQVWLEVAKRRRDGIRSGHVKPIPGEEVLREVRAALRR